MPVPVIVLTTSESPAVSQPHSLTQTLIVHYLFLSLHDPLVHHYLTCLFPSSPSNVSLCLFMNSADLSEFWRSVWEEEGSMSLQVHFYLFYVCLSVNCDCLSVAKSFCFLEPVSSVLDSLFLYIYFFFFPSLCASLSPFSFPQSPFPSLCLLVSVSPLVFSQTTVTQQTLTVHYRENIEQSLFAHASSSTAGTNNEKFRIN